MKLGMFWHVGDTVVNVNDPAKTFEIISVENRKCGTWVKLENLHSKGDYFSGFESKMQRLGYAGYRKDNAIMVSATLD